MKSRLLVLILSFFAVLSLHAREIDNFRGHKVYAKTAIVKLESGSSLKSAFAQDYTPELRAFVASAGATPFTQMFPYSDSRPCSNCVDLSRIYSFSYSADISAEVFIDALSRIPGVIYAQPEFVHELCYTPNDPKLSQQYFHTTIRSYAAWDFVRSDSSIVIGISDTGCDITHEDLVGSIAYNYSDPINGIDDDNDGYIDNFRGWDFGENDNNPSVGDNDHGTWVAGLAAATANNGIGIAGSSYGAKFLPIKIATKNGSLVQTWASIVYAADHGCQIINCSWGSTFREPVGEDVVNYATFNRNALVVAAAGNNATQEEYYPASYRNALSVAGTVANDEKWSSSNSQTKSGSSWGYFVDITAPAASYYSTAKNSSYSFMYGGTSLSSPIVAGVAALVKTAYPQLSAIALGEQLKSQSDKIDTIPFNFPYDDMLGTGRVNAASASRKMNRPGIRYTSYSLNKKTDLLPGDTAVLTVAVANYLAAADSVRLRLEFNTKFIRNISGEQLLLDFASNDTLTGISFGFVLSAELPLDFGAIAKLVYTSGDYRSYEYISLLANPSAKQLITNNLSLSLPANGRLGRTSLSSDRPEVSKIIGYEQLLADAGLYLAEAPNKIASSVLGTQDFNIVRETRPCIDSTSDYCFNAQFRAELLELDIEQRVTAWDDSSFFLIDYKICNSSLLEKPNLIIGNYWDWNILSPWNNYTGYHRPTRMSYTHSTEPATLYIGTMILDRDTNTVFASDNKSVSEGFPDIYHETSYEALYQNASTWRPELRRINLGSNTSVFQSTTAQYLDRSDTVGHRIAVLFSEDYGQLVAQAERLRKSTSQQPTASSFRASEHIRIYPTITHGSVYLEGISADAPAQICIASMDGQILGIIRHQIGNAIEIPLFALPQGIYLITVTERNSQHSFKIVKQ